MTNSKLLENAVASIQLRVEDYQSNDQRRPLSAARNFFSGILLLAKEALVAAAPGADPDLILAARTKPVSDGSGGIKHEAVNNQTVDFNTLGERLKDFGIKVDQAALRALNRIRNDIEHLYTTEPADAVRQAIAKAFPVVIDLCRELGTPPSNLLGDAWPTMIGVKEVYDRELAKCRETFAPVKWMSAAMSDVTLVCPSCRSELVMQDDPDNADHEAVTATCQSCGSEFKGDHLVAHSVAENWDSEAYYAAKGEGSEGIRVWVDTVEGLLGLVAMDAVELHPWAATVDDIEHPDRLIFDLDPGEAVPWTSVVDTALKLRTMLEDEGLQPWPKLTGGKGVHLMVPIQPSLTHAQARSLCHALAQRLERTAPDRFTLGADPALRPGRIFIDYLRNGRGNTAIGAYSPRARPGFPVAAPVTWRAIESGTSPDAYSIARPPRPP